MTIFEVHLYEEWLRRMEDHITQDGNLWIFSETQLMSVLSWDPSEIDYDKADYFDL